MANNTPRNNAPRQQSPTPPGFEDRAPKSRLVIEYDVPNDDGLWDEQTLSFGSIRVIGIKLLSPLEEKAAAQGANNEPLLLAFELGRRSLCEITNDRGEVIQVYSHDATNEQLWAQMHPKLRSLVMNAYAENSSPSPKAAETFRQSRRVKA